MRFKRWLHNLGTTLLITPVAGLCGVLEFTLRIWDRDSKGHSERRDMRSNARALREDFLHTGLTRMVLA